MRFAVRWRCSERRIDDSCGETAPAMTPISQQNEFKTDRAGNVTSLGGLFTVWVQHSQDGKTRNLYLWSSRTLPNSFLRPISIETETPGSGLFSYDLWSTRPLCYREYLSWTCRLRRTVARLLSLRIRKHNRDSGSEYGAGLPQSLRDVRHQ